MGELESLIEARKKINERIKELKNPRLYYGDAKIDLEHYTTSKPDRWYLAYKRNIYDAESARWNSIVSATSKEEIINEIPVIIDTLSGLLDKAMGVKE